MHGCMIFKNICVLYSKIFVCSVLAEPRDGDVRRDVRDADGHPGARHLRHTHLPAAARE